MCDCCGFFDYRNISIEFKEYKNINNLISLCRKCFRDLNFKRNTKNTIVEVKKKRKRKWEEVEYDDIKYLYDEERQMASFNDHDNDFRYIRFTKNSETSREFEINVRNYDDGWEHWFPFELNNDYFDRAIKLKQKHLDDINYFKKLYEIKQNIIPKTFNSTLEKSAFVDVEIKFNQ